MGKAEDMMGKLTARQVANKIGVSPVTARNYCRNGVFPNAEKLNYNGWQVWVVPESDLEGYKQRLTPPGRPPSGKVEYGEYAIVVRGKILNTYKSSPSGARQCQVAYDTAVDFFSNEPDTDVIVKNGEGEDVTFLFSSNGAEK